MSAIRNSYEARLNDPERFNFETLDDVAGVISSPWFIALLHNAATTGNGYWNIQSTERQNMEAVGKFAVSQHGKIEFSENIRQALLLNLRSVYGKVRSSGCPVRHKRPLIDQASLEQLTHYLNLSEAELKATREQSGIEVATHTLAQAMYLAHDLQKEITANASLEALLQA